MKTKTFRRHFRIYFRNGHPAYIVDEYGDYYFHRVTHSKTSGGRTNWEKSNPLVFGGSKKTYIVKREEVDKKNRFSPFILEIRKGVDISYPEIKNTGRSHNNVANNYCASNNDKSEFRRLSPKSIKTN